MANLFAKKDLPTLMKEAVEVEGEQSLRRALGPLNLVTLGIGAIIGAGIFVITGQAAAQFAGPALVISFVLAGVACAFAGLCYAEFASMIPIAGSAYTYSYATLGELVAWIIGWDLILEYAFGAATVAVGWSGHLRAFLHDLGWNMPALPTSDFVLFGMPVHLKYDYVGFIVIMVITTILVIGIKESANFTTAIVIMKVAVVCMFVVLAAWYLYSHSWKPNYWHPFIPPNTGEWGHFGWSGILRGAGVVFFAYIGFDAVSTAAQEAKNPKRDMPFGILGSLVICTVLYILVSGLLTHLVPYQQLNVPDPVVVGIRVAGQQWATFLVEIGALGGLATVMLVMLLGQSRVFYSTAGLAVQRGGRVLAEHRQVLPGEPAEVEEAADVRSHLGDGRILRAQPEQGVMDRLEPQLLEPGTRRGIQLVAEGDLQGALADAKLGRDPRDRCGARQVPAHDGGGGVTQALGLRPPQAGEQLRVIMAKLEQHRGEDGVAHLPRDGLRHVEESTARDAQRGPDERPEQVRGVSADLRLEDDLTRADAAQAPEVFLECRLGNHQG